MRRPLSLLAGRCGPASLALALAGAMHLTLLLRAGDNSADFIVAAIGWMLALLVFEARRDGELPSPPAAAAGFVLIGFGILQCGRMSVTDLWFLKILALLLYAGALLATRGWRGLARQWRGCAVMLIMVVPEKCLPFVDYRGMLTVAHAGAAGFLLHWTGMEVALRGNLIATRAGVVQVEEACSGMALMLLLFKLALMLCLGLPLRWWNGFVACAGALLAGFGAGTFRICVLAVLVNRPSFETLHGAVGANLFPVAGFLLFAPFLIPAEEPLENLLRRAWSGYREDAPGGRAGAAALAMIAAGYCFSIAAGDRFGPERTIPLGRSRAADGLPVENATPVAVPEGLLTRRFNAVQEARLWRINRGGTTWSVLGCGVADAVAGPNELIKDAELSRFIESELPRQNGPPALAGLDAENRKFLTTTEFNAAQRAALFQSKTWLEWLRTGRPLKDCRYNLYVTVQE